MLPGKLDICMQKTETRAMSFTLCKYYLKWLKNLNIRPETLELVQERTGNTLELIGIGNDFLNGAQMIQQLRERIDTWDHMKLKSFSTTKEMVTRLKR
jgi:hypothetical protein